MEKGNRILIGAIFILIVALVSFNSNFMTGAIAKSGVKISVAPDPAESGQKIYVTINPGTEGIYNQACFYQAEDNLRRGCTSQVCDNYRCEEISTFSFSTSGWKAGIYYVQVFDYNVDDYVKEYLTII